jgi:hypothetical protein
VPGSPSRVDLILGSPLGRQLLTSYVSWPPGNSLEPENWQEAISHLTEAELAGRLVSEAFSFGFSGDEEAWQRTALAADQLRPVAAALLDSPGAHRWWDGADLTDQRFVAWDDQPRVAGPALEQTIRACMQAERADNDEGRRRPRPAERPRTRIGACWWSPPGFAPESWTTPAFGALPAGALYQFFDTFLPRDADEATVWSMAMRPGASVLEVGEPGDWQGLVARFPRDVTGTHDGEWRYWGGAPGPWLLPDWEHVMDSYDGVHVSVGAAISSAGLALPVHGGYTMLFGWVPGATLWLRDVTVKIRRLGWWHGGLRTGYQDGVPAEWTAGPESG